MLTITRLDSSASDFDACLGKILVKTERDTQVSISVSEILQAVQEQGDSALLAYTKRFDHFDAPSVEALKVDAAVLRHAKNEITSETLSALKSAAARVRRYAEKQKLSDWDLTDDDGTVVGQKVTPLDSVGLYIPGGKAAYPSSLLMTAIPAQIAGVPRIVAAMPSPGGELNPILLAAADLCGVSEIYQAGGAQMIAAFAYGTQSIEPVSKIVGPGNQYVAEAKRQVFGRTGIDMIAGPSEIVVIADGSGNPDWVGADLLSQAEHDECARAILLCPDEKFIAQVLVAMENLIEQMPRADIIRASLKNEGLLVQVADLDDALRIANKIAPEHLELAVEKPSVLVSGIRNAGAIFMGHYSSEVVGDYCAGPNHVLPTRGAAQYASPLGVYDFQKRSSLVHCTAAGAAKLGRIAQRLAYDEGLSAHADAALRRVPSDSTDS